MLSQAQEFILFIIDDIIFIFSIYDILLVNKIFIQTKTFFYNISFFSVSMLSSVDKKELGSKTQLGLVEDNDSVDIGNLIIAARRTRTTGVKVKRKKKMKPNWFRRRFRDY